MGDQEQEQVDYSNDVEPEIEETEIDTVSEGNKNESQELNPECSVFVTRFRPPANTEEAFREHFGKFGEVKKVLILGKTGYVEFETAEQAVNAKESCHMKPGLECDSLIVDFKKGGMRGRQEKRRFDHFDRGNRHFDQHRDFGRRDFHRGKPYHDNNYGEDRFGDNRDRPHHHGPRFGGRSEYHPPQQHEMGMGGYGSNGGNNNNGPRGRDDEYARRRRSRSRGPQGEDSGFHPEHDPRAFSGPGHRHPPRDFPPRDFPPRDFPPRDLPPRDVPPPHRDFPPQHRDFPPRDFPQRDFPPRDFDAPPRGHLPPQRDFQHPPPHHHHPHPHHQPPPHHRDDDHHHHPHHPPHHHHQQQQQPPRGFQQQHNRPPHHRDDFPPRDFPPRGPPPRDFDRHQQSAQQPPHHQQHHQQHQNRPFDGHQRSGEDRFAPSSDDYKRQRY